MRYLRSSQAVLEKAAQGGGDLRQVVATLLGRAGTTSAAPGPTDHVILLRGLPVVPWINLKPPEVVWGAWLQRLAALYAEWRALPAAAESQPLAATLQPATASLPALLPSWEAWCREHLMLLDIDGARQGMRQLVSVLADPALGSGKVHLVGHSSGGLALLLYLARWRAGAIQPPLAQVRTAFTLHAAALSLDGVRLRARRLSATSLSRLSGLGRWTAQQGIALLTVCNEREWWSHRALADIPYLGLQLGSAVGLRGQLDGTMHDLIRRLPQLAEAVWSDG
jgi:hypothetical protein